MASTVARLAKKEIWRTLNEVLLTLDEPTYPGAQG